MSQPAITIDNLGKAYRLGVAAEKHDTFRDMLVGLARAPLKRFRALSERRTERDEFWALRGVSFEVQRGEVVGIIGRNGAGKSTLLKVLSRITEPTEGQARLRGRVASLLEVGTGFHPELTGRENIYLNGAIMGMKMAEIKQKFDQIVAFAEVEQFLDTPVKRYSSGMYVRLAFAVAAHLEPEILIVDEVLAVGDAEFQKRCLGKMQEVATDHGRTVLFVSHNMGAVQQLCPRAILLHKGRAVMDGPSPDVVQEYLSTAANRKGNMFDPANPERRGNRAVFLTGGRVLDQSGEVNTNVMSGQPVALEFDYEKRGRAPRAEVSLTIFNAVSVAVTHASMALTGEMVTSLGSSGRFRCVIDRLALPLGTYRVSVAVRVDGELADVVNGALKFDVLASTFYPTGHTPPLQSCAVMIDHRWEHDADSLTASSNHLRQEVHSTN